MHDSTNTMARRLRGPRRAAAIAALIALAATTGCVVTSPLDEQEIPSTSHPVVFTAWTTQASGEVVVECSPAARYGIDDELNPPRWREIDRIAPAPTPWPDDVGQVVYRVGRSVAMPDGCWRPSGVGNHYTVVRMRQYIDGRWRPFHTLDADGLDCVVDAVGDTGNWFGWADAGCVTTDPRGRSKGWAVLRVVHR